MKLNSSSSLIIKYFLLFLSLFIIPIIVVCVIMNVHTNSVFRNITTEWMQYSLDSILKTSESAFEEAEKIVIQLTYNDCIEDTTSIPNSERKSVSDIYKFYEVFDLLQSMTESNKNLESILIYNSDLGYVISSERRVDDIEFYSKSQWYKEYKKKNDTLVWVKDKIETFEYSNLKEKGILSAMYPVAQGGTFNGAIIINIPVERITRTAYRNSEIFIVSPGNKGILPLSYTEEFSLSDENRTEIKSLIAENKERSGTVFFKFNGEKIVTSFTTSNYNNMCFVMVSTESELFSIVNNLMWFVITVVILMLMVGLVVATVLSRRFYSPVKRIVDDIKQRMSDSSVVEDEWRYIEQSVDNLIKSEKETKEIKEKEQINKRSMLIKQIISDGIEDWEDYHEFFIYQNYFVIIARIDDVTKFVSEYTGIERRYMLNLALDVIKNIINSNSGLIADGFVNENSFTVLVNTEKDNLLHISMFPLVLKEVKRILNSDVTLAVGTIVEAGSVSVSYETAKQAFEERFFVGGGTVIFHREKNKTFEDVKLKDSALINNLKLVNREQIYTYLEEIIAELKSTNNAEYARQQMMLLLVTLLKLSDENNIPVAALTTEQSALGELMNCKTINEAHKMLVNVCDNIMKHFEILLDENNFKNRIMEYVNKNYCSDIDVYTMAYELGVSYSQLRRIFMELTGENIVVYTNRLRIERAKKMLVQTDKTILEIASETGYNNDQSFNRNFKKFEGLTPGEYRKKHINL